MDEISPAVLRKFIFDRFVETSQAPLLEEIMARFQLPRDDALGRLRELQNSHHVFLLPGTGRILMANPFSNLPTPFRVFAGSAKYNANCAWDAIALHVVLERDIRISSYCHECAAPIEFGLSHGKRTSDEGRGVVVFLATPVSQWYDNLLVTCSNTMVFFQSQKHLIRWRNLHPGISGESLSVDKTIEVVTPISKGRASMEYKMPSRDELMAHWESIGVRGPFWKF